MDSTGRKGTLDASRLNRRFVFVAGLHRSGTTLLANLLGEHPEISHLRDAAGGAEEGQHLQSVYPVGRVWGADAVGRVGFDPFAYLTERSKLAAPDKADALFAQWARYWDLSRPVLLEKSPPNIIRTRYLQACFPDSAFIVIVRHPIASSIATKKWCRRNPVLGIMANWALCYGRFLHDRPHLKRSLIVRYEALVADPEAELRRITDFLGLAPLAAAPAQVRDEINEKYFARWRAMSARPLGKAAAVAGRLALGGSLRRFGYRFSDAGN